MCVVGTSAINIGKSVWHEAFNPRDALDGKGSQRWPQKRVDRRLEEVAEAVGGWLLSVTNAIEAGTLHEGNSSWE